MAVHQGGEVGSDRYLIGIDDTDNLTSRGTGFCGRRLSSLLAAEGLAQPDGITRHQLFVDPRIPYTSHNSSLCVSVDADSGKIADITEFCRDFLLRESAPGADAGLCIAPFSAFGAELQEFGNRAKREVVTRAEAEALAQSRAVHLEGLTGDFGGVIGALAGCGLRAGARDGRFVWVMGVRRMCGVFDAETILRTTGIQEIRSLTGEPIAGPARIETSPWPRPVMIDGRAVLLVEQATGAESGYEWNLAPKHIIKSY